MIVLAGMTWKLAARCSRCVGVWRDKCVNAWRVVIILVYITGLWAFSAFGQVDIGKW